MTDTYYRYDYAWKTPGWTAQNPTFIQSSDGYSDPGLPDDVHKVEVYGQFLDWETGRELEGVFEVRCTDVLIYTPTGTQVMPGKRKIRFNKGGFSMLLPACDDDQLAPEFRYIGKLTVAGKAQEFQFTLSVLDTRVNVTSLLPAPTGSIVVTEGDTPGGVSIGAVPPYLEVNLTTGADFRTVLTSDDPWDSNDHVILKVPGFEWPATISGSDAIFDVDKNQADQVPDGSPARLVVVNGSDDAVWAVGRVVRHGGVIST